MEELFEALGLDEDAPTAKAVEKVNKMQGDLEDKNKIISGLQNQIKNLENQIDSIADGVAEARVKDLVHKVQNETGYHVGKDNMQTLNKKAAQYLYASEDDKEDIYNDMKAHTIAYGQKIGMDEKINSLTGSRDSSRDENPRYAEAKRLVDSGEAETWEKAYEMVQEKEFESKTDKEDN